jgi:hypothetical protein
MTQFTVVPTAILRNPILPPGARLLYSILSSYAQAGRGAAFPRQDTLAQEVGVDTRTIRRHVELLVSEGLIVIERTKKPDGSFGRNVYHLHGFEMTLDGKSNDLAPDTSVLSDRTPMSGLDRTPMSDRYQEHPDQQQPLPSEEGRSSEEGQTPKQRKRFTPPTVEEVFIVFVAKDLSRATAKLQAEKFVAFYESKGWFVGKTKMTSWKAAAAGWVLRGQERGEIPRVALTEIKRVRGLAT